MSRALSSLFALLLLLAAAFPVAADDAKAAPTSEADAPPVVHETGEVVPGEVIVKFRDEASAGEVARARGLDIAASNGAGGHGLPAVATTRGRPVDEVLAELRTDAAVEYAEPSYRVQLLDDGAVAAVSVDDPQTGGQYSLDRMRVRDAWSRSKGGAGIVAVLDTGVQPDHPDLSGRVLRGRDIVNNDSNAADDNGHGTWVAGIIAAKPNDGYGIAGISWTDKILPVKIMNSSGTGSTSALVSGIIWAADHGATVINMSVGGFPYSQAVQDAVTYAWNKGAVLVGAAGNNNREESFYPASMNHVISVSATQPQDEFSHWSSYGPAVDVSAPGSSVLTTNCIASICPHPEWGSHTYISGTSFATPNVAGVVALIRAQHPTWTPEQVVGRLYATVDDLGFAGWDNRYGRGRVNAYRALGASVAASPRPAGDGLETNSTLAAARVIPLGTATHPSIYPAGDIDVFAVDVPRAGRLDVRVTGVVDSRDWTWRQSSLQIDPIVELFTTGGTLLQRVDAVWQDGVELAQTTVSGPTRILVRVTNYFANGNQAAYAITPTYVDTVAPTISTMNVVANATEVSQWIVPSARFSERVQNVTSSTVRIRDMQTMAAVPAQVTYDASTREVRVTPTTRLEGTHGYRFELAAGITDMAGNPIARTRVAFTTSNWSFSDIAGTPFAEEIEWMVAREITRGCDLETYCPLRELNRGEMATFLARALDLPPATRDHFTDDNRSSHQDAINRLAEAGITTGCGGTRYCPWGIVRRGPMASFLARALDLPATTRDYFTDDAGLSHEANINRVAAAGTTTGCGASVFCPDVPVNRQQIAAFLYRSLGD